MLGWVSVPLLVLVDDPDALLEPRERPERRVATLAADPPLLSAPLARPTSPHRGPSGFGLRGEVSAYLSYLL